ncbi:MAG TPA: hypothetical protein VNJ10_08055 [Sphingomonas sp.]|nr:hypothetical protein [Sphingomonas sp.]
MIPLVIKNHPYRRSWTSGANLFVVLLVLARPSQEMGLRKPGAVHIESVTIYPDGKHNPEAEVVAKVADLVAFATNDNPAHEGGDRNSIVLVAGTGFGRCRTRFRLIGGTIVRL